MKKTFLKNSGLGAFWVALAACMVLSGGCSLKPQPLTDEENFYRLQADKQAIAVMQTPASGPIDIYEAIARTIKYNLDNRLAGMETTFALKQLETAQWQMLPRLAANAGYTYRNNESASTSISYEKRTVSLEPSVSSEQERRNADLSFSWSLLDFGIGYYQAKQQANTYLILQERHRRVLNNLVKEVISAYCHVASLEAIRPQVEEAMAAAMEALENYRALEASGTAHAVAALEQQRGILSLLRQLRQHSADLAVSRVRLATLMNIPHDQPFEIVPLEGDMLIPAEIHAELPYLEDLGLFLRPDLREEAYRSRIDRDEVKKEFIRLFPGVTLFANLNHDSNKYLVHDYWAEAGAKATMDILGLPARIKKLQGAATQTEVSDLRRQASSLAAMLQINMSYYQYRQAMVQYHDSREMNRIDEKLSQFSSAAAASRSIGRMEHIVQSVTSVGTHLEMDKNRTDVFSAWANLYFSIGCDILQNVDGNEDLNTLMGKVRGGLQRMLTGELPAVSSLAALHPEESAPAASTPAASSGPSADSPVKTERRASAELSAVTLPYESKHTR